MTFYRGSKKIAHSEELKQMQDHPGRNPAKDFVEMQDKYEDEDMPGFYVDACDIVSEALLDHNMTVDEVLADHEAECEEMHGDLVILKQEEAALQEQEEVLKKNQEANRKEIEALEGELGTKLSQLNAMFRLD